MRTANAATTSQIAARCHDLRSTPAAGKTTAGAFLASGQRKMGASFICCVMPGFNLPQPLLDANPGVNGSNPHDRPGPCLTMSR